MELTSKSLSSLTAIAAPSTAICGNKTVERMTTAAEAATATAVPLLEKEEGVSGDLVRSSTYGD